MVQVEASQLFKRGSSHFGTWTRAIAAAGLTVEGDRSIGAELRGLQRLRLARKLTQREVAQRSGVSQGHVSDIERGIYRPRAETAAAIAAALGVEVAELLGG